MNSSTERYLFGDSDLAARRLQKLAEVFEPTSRAFLSETAAEGLALAYDLGCGPGLTTQLASGAVGARLTVGLENADRFIELANEHAGDRIAFRKHDITETPFPDGPADLIYARFVLAHLRGIEELPKRWASQLRECGLLLLEEVERIETDVAPFQTYLDTVDAMLMHNGSQLYAGRALADLTIEGLRVRRNKRIKFDVDDCDAAAMFVPNIATWKDEPFVRERHSADAIATLSDALRARLESAPGRSGIRWTMRQVAYERD